MTALFESLTGFALLDPWLLSLALLVPLGLWVRRRRGAPAVRFGPGFIAGPGLPRSWRTWILWLPRALQALGLLSVVLALARPVERVRLPQRNEGIDILLCLDTSSSMSANDLDPARTRLDVAKDAAARFVAGRSDDRIGLIAFARYPDLRSPPTRDHRSLTEILSGVTLVASDGPEDATGIGTAVARAAQVLGRSAAKSKVVILLTDGEENVATAETPQEIAPLHAAQLCEELGVRVYAIAAGLDDRSSSSQVEHLAERSGGEFYAARDAGAVAGVYARIDELEKSTLEEPRYELAERFLPFLISAVALFFVGRLLACLLEVLP